ncbi:MAG TPA: cohesin domain-containing protein [Candidatus Acidoferrales bacterium]|nr:cohesin domain-containing protein [Candidatus Acidoferrales bacterium]
MRCKCTVFLAIGLGLFAAGCPGHKGQSDYDKGRKAQDLSDWDAAVNFYQNALKQDPNSANYRIRLDEARFEASQQHVKKGEALAKQGDLQMALAEFQRAVAVNPGNPIAEQELKRTMDQIAEKERANEAAAPAPTDESALAAAPPEMKPLSHAPITLKMTNDAKIVFETIGKFAGLTMVFDPDFPARRIPVDLNNVTLEQALDIAALESKAVWKPVTENIVFVYPDQPAKRRDFEEQVVQTFYLSNTVQAQDLTEIVTGLRQLLELKRIQQVNSQNAIIIRDTPDKLLLAKKMIEDIDKARPEVMVQVSVLEARTDRLRNLGVLPGQTAAIAFTPPGSTTTNNNNGNGTGTGSTPTNSIPLNQLGHLSSSDYSVTLPGATVTAILTDSDTKIIQNPEIRSIDGQQAKLRIGDKVPIATGSFQAGVGVGSTAATGFVNPLVNTQFQYQDVGVNIDLTPRVHPNHEISIKATIEVSSVTGQSQIGGIQQPIISQRKTEQDIRLKEGESSILGGLFSRTDTKTLNGWPGLAKIPFLRYLFSQENVDHQEDEILIVLTPRIVRLPEWTKANLQGMLSGSETNIEVKKRGEVAAPAQQPAKPEAPAAPAGQAPGAPPAAQPSTGANAGTQAKLRFEPASISLKTGQTTTVGVVVDNVSDLYSIPMLLQYDPNVISIEEVQHGGFLSGGTQEIAIVQQVNKERGQAIISATRQPNTPGVNGSGTLMGIVIKALKPGTSNLSIVQVNAKDSQQRLIPMVTGEATVQVQP